MTLSCRVLYLVFILLLLLVSRPEHRCLGLSVIPPDGSNNTECLPVDIQLYTWSGPGFESGECWYQGYRFLDGATWSRIDTPGAPYCVCEQGKVRVFYTQKSVHKPVVADSLTLLRPVHGSSPTSNDLAKWPIPNVAAVRQRSIICSASRLNRRVRSRDGCTGCKCSTNGHWLCRRPPNLSINRTRQRQTSRNYRSLSSNPSSKAVNVQLRVSTLRARSQCPANTTPQFCILIERLSSTNTSDKSSRYIEIPRETAWTDRNTCTRCSCTSDARLSCEYLRSTCRRPCLIHKTRPVSLMYYFPAGSRWLTPPNDKCRSCSCVNGLRKCINCDQVLKIDIDATKTDDPPESAIGEYRLLPSSSTSAKTVPCLLQTNINSHRLILPGQQTWFEQRCYFCSKINGRLIPCYKMNS